MEKDIQERFNRIEKNIDRVVKRMDVLETHVNAVLDSDKSSKALYIAWGLVAFFAGSLGIMMYSILFYNDFFVTF